MAYLNKLENDDREHAIMKVAAGRIFFERYSTQAQAIVADLQWALLEADGSWSASPQACDLVVYAHDAYRPEFAEQIVQLSTLRWLHTEDAGVDGPFYDAIRAKGAILTNSPGTNAPEVAEFAFSLLLWSAKRLGVLQMQQQQHRWHKLALESLSDKTLLIVGLGAIGGRVATFAKGFGMRVLGIRQAAERVADVDQQGTLADLPQFLSAADFVVLALPATPATNGIIDRTALACMQPTATLINVGRGTLIDLSALQEALATGQLYQACLDVLPSEPWPAGDPLWDLPNLFLTPHNASSSPLYLPRVAEIWLDNLRRYVQGQALLQRVC
jgi:phosphoglycerate dehydrogenase-like enzyme